MGGGSGNGRRLCVLTMIDSMMTAGAEILATRIALGLDRTRFESVICSTRPSPSEHVEAARARGVEVLELGRASKVDLWSWAPLVQLLRSGRVDVLHAHKFGSNLWAAILARLARPPVLLTHEHSWSFEGAPLRRLVDRELIARAADVVLAVSERDRERMVEVEGIPRGKVRVVRNGIPDPPAGDRARARADLGIPPDAPVVGTVCGLRPEKALEVALAGVAPLVARHPGLRFVVVGDGPERGRLETLAASLAVPTLFLGRRPNEDVPDLLAAMDVLVCSSRFEGMPLAMLEWMAAGRAIVAPRVGGIPLLLEDGVHGLLVPAADAEALGAAVGRLLEHPGERRRLGEAARARQQAEFRLRHTLDALESLYVSMAAAAGRA
jgi:glycosyltransferase involved in cell wall biosynthesis